MANYIVDILADENDGNTSAGDLSLREAIALANGNGNSLDTITFASSLAGGTITLTGELMLTTSMTIDGDVNGDDKADITISGGDTTRIFQVINRASDVDLLSLDLRDGFATTDGGAVRADYVGQLDIVHTTISSSSSGNSGGALSVADSNLRVFNSSITGNSAVGGGGINIVGRAIAEITNSTIHGNTASTGGGVRLDDSIAAFFNTTVAGNSATGLGGGIFVGASNAVLRNTVVATNTAGLGASPDVTGNIGLSDNSFFGTPVTIIGYGVGNIINGGDPGFAGGLGDHGGTVQTLLPIASSPLVDAGANGHIRPDLFDIDRDGNTSEPLPLDARGATRLFGAAVDIGAVEQSIDQFIVGGPGPDDLDGLDGDDTISGNGDNDKIDGGSGDDSLDGGSGVDLADYSSATAGVTVDLGNFGWQATGGAGTDKLANFEGIIGSAFADVLLRGFAPNVLIQAGNGDDVVHEYGGEPGQGDDTFEGGDGIDTIDYVTSSYSGLTVDLANGVSSLSSLGDVNQLIGFENAGGTAAADLLIGSSVGNALVGRGGNDTLRGGDGDDTLDGGADDDTADYSDGGGAVTVDLGLAGAQDIGAGRGKDTLISIEHVIGGSLGDTITGNGAANRLDGGSGGADKLFGLGGNDTLIGGVSGDLLDGGADDDWLIGGAGNDTITGGTGRDWADYSGFGGAVTVNLSTTTAQSTAAGGTDTLSGLENLLGGIGNDALTGTAAAGGNTIQGGRGSDTINGLGGADLLEGQDGNDVIQGGTGADTIIGGEGRDILRGSADADVDVFRFLALTDSLVGGQRDRIDDFDQGEDLIDLAALDAVAGGADDAFTFIDAAGFSGNAGELRYLLVGAGATAQTIVEGDVDGNGGADFQIALKGHFALVAGDFVL